MESGGEVVVDEVAAVCDSRDHVDTVGQDETNTTEETSEDQRGGEKDEGEYQHCPVVPKSRREGGRRSAVVH